MNDLNYILTVQQQSFNFCNESIDFITLLECLFSQTKKFVIIKL